MYGDGADYMQTLAWQWRKRHSHTAAYNHRFNIVLYVAYALKTLYKLFEVGKRLEIVVGQTGDMVCGAHRIQE